MPARRSVVRIGRGGQLVAASGGLVDQLVAVADQAFEAQGGLGQGQAPAHQLLAVGHLDALLELIVQVVGQAQRVALIGLEQATGPTLDVHDVDGNVHSSRYS